MNSLRNYQLFAIQVITDLPRQAQHRAFNKSPFSLTTANQTLIIGKKRGLAKKKMQLSDWCEIADAMRRNGKLNASKKNLFFFIFSLDIYVTYVTMVLLRA